MMIGVTILGKRSYRKTFCDSRAKAKLADKVFVATDIRSKIQKVLDIRRAKNSSIDRWPVNICQLTGIRLDGQVFGRSNETIERLPTGHMFLFC
jgi:hypothetical protein